MKILQKRRVISVGIWWGDWKEGNQLEDLDVDGMIVFK
jgi:hypothetical protein